MEILIAILIIAVIWIYAHFNSKVDFLQQEINALKRQQQSTTISEKISIENGNKVQPSINIVESTPIPERQIVEAASTFEEQKPIPKPDFVQEKTSQVTTFLKQNALSVIGIFTLILGVGYFVKYAIDKNWIGETARVAIGLSTGFLIMGFGHWLRKNYKIFSSIITGGGISILYLTITIAFQEYQIFSQNIAFAILCVITIISVLLAYLYKSEVLIVVALLGGFFAPLMITNGQSNYLFLFSYISILNLGMLVIAYLTKWKSIGWLSFVLTSCYLLAWTIDKPNLQLIFFHTLSYLIFYAFALQSYVKKAVLSSSEILILVLNNLFSITALVYIFNVLNYQAYSIFPLAFAVLNGLLAWREINAKTREPNFSVFIAIMISFISIAVALELKSHYITAIWAIEASLLLFIWKKSGHYIFKKCFNILFPLLIIAQIFSWNQYYQNEQLAIIFNPVFLTSLVVIASILFNLFYIKNLTEDEELSSKFDYIKIFAGLSYLVIYLSISFEIWYHIKDQSESFISGIILLYSIYFTFGLLLLRKKLNISDTFTNFLIGMLLIILILNTIIPNISYSIKTGELSSRFYTVHLLQWIPFLILIFKIIPNSEFLKEKFGYWAITAVGTLLFSYEMYHLYILLRLNNIAEYQDLISHFCVLYLPIIWALLAVVFIYFGLKKQTPELSKSGFALIGITVLKLYFYDVWQMDNVSRIIAFIILGIILLLSSFLFQRLKNIIASVIDNQAGKSEQNDKTEL